MLLLLLLLLLVVVVVVGGWWWWWWWWWDYKFYGCSDGRYKNIPRTAVSGVLVSTRFPTYGLARHSLITFPMQIVERIIIMLVLMMWLLLLARSLPPSPAILRNKACDS